MGGSSFLRALERLSRSCETDVSAGVDTGLTVRPGSEGPCGDTDEQGRKCPALGRGRDIFTGVNDEGLDGLLAEALLEAGQGRFVVAEEYADRLVKLFLAMNVPVDITKNGASDVSSPEFPDATGIRGVL